MSLQAVSAWAERNKQPIGKVQRVWRKLQKTSKKPKKKEVRVYATVNDIPAKRLDAIVELMRQDKGKEASREFNTLIDSVKNLKDYEVVQLREGIRKKANQSQQSYTKDSTVQLGNKTYKVLESKKVRGKTMLKLEGRARRVNADRVKAVDDTKQDPMRSVAPTDRDWETL